MSPGVAAAFVPSPAALPRSHPCPAVAHGLCRTPTRVGALRARPLLPRPRRVALGTRARPRACASHDAAPPPPAATPASPLLSALTAVSGVVTTLFPVLTVAASLVALRWPALFSALTGSWVITTALSVLMLSMGLTLRPVELLAAARRPAPLLFNLASCYVLMPAIALLLARLFGLTGTTRAGLLLLSIVSGGQASNLCTHIARGDVALSVTLTTATTLAAAVALPALSQLLLGTTVPVDAGALALSTARVTLLPLLAGATLRGLAPRTVGAMQPALPAIGVVAVVSLVLGPVSLCAGGLDAAWATLLVPVVLLHVVGGVVGFVVPWLGGAGWRAALTIAFETGFKSPALGFVLARKCFPPGVHLASAVSIVALAPIAALCAVLIRSFTRPEAEAAGE